MEYSPGLPASELINQIETLKLELIQKGTELGINNNETIRLSQDLDKLIYQYLLLEDKKIS